MRVHFNLVNGAQCITDAAGIDVADLEEARSQAKNAIVESISEEVFSPYELATWRLEAVDSSGAVLFSFNLDSMVS